MNKEKNTPSVNEDYTFDENDKLAVNTLRMLSVAQVQRAQSGHPGLPLGASPMAYTLWAKHLRVNPNDSKWMNRDRFVLSAGHGSELLYSMLHLSGFDVTIEDLKDFRQLKSRTPGHPEVNHTDGVEATTGPLGQGFAQAVGMAISEKHMAAKYNTEKHKVIDHFTYVLCGDGDLMEGISYEAASYAGHMNLNKLIVLYDSNDITLDGSLDMSFKEDIKGRFESQGWNYIKVKDGNDLNEISEAITQAKNQEEKPTLIEVKTVIGQGAPNEGTNIVHGAALSDEDWDSTKEYYKWKDEDFVVPESVIELFNERVVQRGQMENDKWNELFEAYKADEPELADSLSKAVNKELPADYDKELKMLPADEKGIATRAASGEVIQILSESIPYLWGGSADLSGSNKTMSDSESDFMPDNYEGRNIWFGVREFAMGAMMNGISLHGGTIVYGGTFFVFSDYLKAAIRLGAISKLPNIYTFTHDSVAVGEDGPTHQPIEQLAQFRSMPNLNVFRPADANETIMAWKMAVESEETPTMLVLSRQNLPILEGSYQRAEEGVRKGGYVISEAQSDSQDGVLIAAGSEVSLAIEVQEKLLKDGIDVSVVSMVSQELFDQQSKEYQASVLPNNVRNRMSIELGATYGWEKYVGLDGITVGVDTFGESGKGEEVLNHFGFTSQNLSNLYKDTFK